MRVLVQFSRWCHCGGKEFQKRAAMKQITTAFFFLLALRLYSPAQSNTAQPPENRIEVVLLGKFGITVNAMCPGVIDTELTREHASDGLLERLAASYPVPRLGTALEVADLICFAASEAAWRNPAPRQGM